MSTSTRHQETATVTALTRFVATLAAVIPHPIWIRERSGRFLVVNQPFADLIDRRADDFSGRFEHELLARRDLEFLRFIGQGDREVLTSGTRVRFLHDMEKSRGERQALDVVKDPVRDGHGRVQAIIGQAWPVESGLSRQRWLEALQRQVDEYEISLRTLMDMRERDRLLLENRVHETLRQTVLPHLEQLHRTPLDAVQKLLLDSAIDRLKGLRESRPTPGCLLELTPAEMQVAEMIRQGLTTKEIADQLSLSAATVATHRRNIRKRLGLRQKKVSLCQYLRIHLLK